MRFLFFLFSIVFVSATSEAVVIYSSPEALLSSGDIPLGKLRKLPGHIAIPWVNASSTESAWLRENTLYLATDFATTLSLPDKTLVEKIKKEGTRFLVQTSKGKVWVDEKLCSPTLRGKTMLVTKHTTQLRIVAGNKNTRNILIPSGTTLFTEKIIDHEAQVSFRFKGKMFSGWVSLYDTLSLLDFASVVTTTKDSQWQEVEGVSGPWLTLASGNLVSRRELKLLRFKLDRAFVRLPEIQGRLNPRTDQNPTGAHFHFAEKIDFAQNFVASWRRAGDAQGGRIWFRDNSLPLIVKEIDLHPTTLKELLTRGLFDIAEAPNLPQFKIASAQGVFLQIAEDHWKELSSFGKRDYPVAIDRQKNIYVGIYKSADGGEHFEPYLRWDQIMDRYQVDVNQVRVKSLKYNTQRMGIEVLFTAGDKTRQPFTWFVRDLKIQRPFGPVLDRVKHDVSPKASALPKWAGILAPRSQPFFVSN